MYVGHDELVYLTEFYKENEGFIESLNKNCRYHHHGSRHLKLSDNDKEEYSDAVILAAERLILQKPKAVFLPTRGGALHGIDICDTLDMISMVRGGEYHPQCIEIQASGVGTKERVRRQIRHQLDNLKKAEKEYKEFWNFDDFTIIDSAYTGMAYRKLLRIFRESFPSSKINGIILRDKMYSKDNGVPDLAYTHKTCNNGDFFWKDVNLPWEDLDLMYHDISRDERFEVVINLPTPEYYQERLDIMKRVMTKIGLPTDRV